VSKITPPTALEEDVVVFVLPTGGGGTKDRGPDEIGGRKGRMWGCVVKKGDPPRVAEKRRRGTGQPVQKGEIIDRKCFSHAEAVGQEKKWRFKEEV